MIVISPAVVRPYAPSSTPIGAVTSLVQVRELGPSNPPQLAAQIFLWTADGKQIAVDTGALRAMTAAESAAFLAEPAIAGETEIEGHDRKLLPYLASAFNLAPTPAAAPAAKKTGTP